VTRTAPSPDSPFLHREVQAQRDLGSTAVRPAVAGLLAGACLGVLAGAPLLQLAVPGGSAPFAELGRAVAGARDAAGPLAANAELLAAMDRFETALEEDSWLVEELLPPVQLALTGALGAGNTQVVPGRGGWLFYRPGVDEVTGPGFLEPARLRARRRGGEGWEEPPNPDPRPALRELGGVLGARGIRLLVLPAPSKASVHPERLSSREVRWPVQNPSLPRLVAELERAGIAVLDPAPRLVAAARRGARPQYLCTDSHWTPAAMEVAARAAAAWIEEHAGLAGPRRAYRRRARAVEGRGDLRRMLELPAGARLYPPQRVTAWPVTGPGGAPWGPDPAAEVLVLGDSFTNVFSRAELGWGGGAGLAEQLSFLLQRPVDRIAVNAGGAYASRQALARELAAGRDRLRGKRVVVYELAARELSSGDWRLVWTAGVGRAASSPLRDRSSRGAAGRGREPR
jgi:alginate O-acetyltransferase complex protein AlgJ